MRKTSRSRLFKVCTVLFIVFFALAVLVGFSACSGCGGDEEEEPEVESVTLDKTSLELEVGGSDATLTATVKMSDDSDYSGSYTWSSSKTTVAAVSGSSNTGTVKAVAEGDATITVTAGSKSATCSVKVTDSTGSENPESPVTYDNTKSFEAEDAALMNGVSSTTGVTASLMKTETSTKASGNACVSNFDTTGDKILFQVLASAAVTVQIDLVASTTYFAGTTLDVSTIPNLLTVNGTAVTLTGTLSNGFLSFYDFGTVTATGVSLNAGINYIVLDYQDNNMNMDKIDLSWDGTATIEAVNDYTGEVFEVDSSKAVTLQAEDAALMNAVGVSGDTYLLGTEADSKDERVTQVNNFNAKGDMIVFQILTTAAIENVSLDLYARLGGTHSTAYDSTNFISVNGETVSHTGSVASSSYGSPVTATISLQAGINYIVIEMEEDGSTLFGMNMGLMNVDRIDLWAGSVVADNFVTGAYDGTNEEYYYYRDSVSQNADYFTDSVITSVEYEANSSAGANDVAGTFTVNGTSAVMTPTQRAAFWGAGANNYVGDEYIVVTIVANEGERFDVTTNKNNTYSIIGSDPDSDNTFFSLFYDVTEHEDEEDGDTTPAPTSTTEEEEKVLFTVTDSTGTYNVVLGDIESLSDEYGDDKVNDESSGRFVTGAYTGENDEYYYYKDSVSQNADYFTDSVITSVEYDETTKTYTVNGVSAFMDPNQLAAFWGAGASDHIGAEYIVVTIVAQAGETITVKTAKNPNTGYTLNGNSTKSDETFFSLFYDVTNAKAGTTLFTFTIGSDSTEYTVVLGDVSRTYVQVTAEDNFVGSYVEGESVDGYFEYTNPDADDDSAASFTGSEVTVTFDEDSGNFVVSGSATFMTEEQLKAFWGQNGYVSHEGAQYIVVTIVANPGETITIYTQKGNIYSLNGSSENVDDTFFTLFYDVTSYTSGSEGKTLFTFADSTGTYDVVLGEITLAKDYTCNFVTSETEDTNIPSDAYTYANPDDDTATADFTGSVVTSVVFDGEKYIVSGNASLMNADQLAAFWGSGASEHEGAQYIAVTIVAGTGESFTVKTAKSTSGLTIDGDVTENGGNFYTLLFDVTNYTEESVGNWLFTIVDGNGLEYKVVLGEITLAAGYTSNFVTGDLTGVNNAYVSYTNPDEGDESTATFTESVVSVEFVDGQYVVSGTAAVMTEEQCKAFWGQIGYSSHTGAQYIVITIAANAGESFTVKTAKTPNGIAIDGDAVDSTIGEKDIDGTFYTLIYDVSSYTEESVGKKLFTIVDETDTEYDVVLGTITLVVDTTVDGGEG